MLLSISSSEPRIRQGATNALLGMAAAFAISLLVMAMATEWLLQRHVLPQDTREAHLTLLSQAQTPDAAFGDSHAARGFDAQKGFVNLAYPSENIEDMIAKASRYFANHPPGRIILQADPHLFAPYRIFTPPQPLEPLSGPALFSDRHRPRLLGYWEAFFRGSGTLLSRVEVTAAGALLSEGDLSAVPLRRRHLEALDRRRWHSLEASDAMSRAQSRYVHLLDTLAARGARICLVSYPVSADYAAATADAGHAAAVAFFQREAARVGARFVDARRSVAQDEHFRDVDHLNRAGARAFAPVLIDSCFGTAD